MSRILGVAVLLFACSSHAEQCDPVTDVNRIAVAGGSITEIIYLLGYEDRLVGVDSTSNYPVAATHLPSVGYVRNLSVEGLLSLQPTLILGEDDMGPPTVLEQLKHAGVDTRRIPERHDAQGILAKIECVASLLNVPQDETEARLQEFRTVAEKLKNAHVSHPSSEVNVALLLSLDSGAPIAAGDNTSGGGFLRIVGATNVFAELDGWKPVSPEFMTAANPDVIVIPTRGANAIGGIEGAVSHPSLRATQAILNDRIVVLDGMAMLGFGPRTLQTALDFAIQMRRDGFLESPE